MSDEEEPTGLDVALVHGRTDDGGGVLALRLRPGRLDHAVIRPAKEEPIGSRELVRLRPRGESGLLYDVDVVFDGRTEGGATREGHAGPARVSTAQYRKNWDAVFGGGKRGPVN